MLTQLTSFATIGLAGKRVTVEIGAMGSQDPGMFIVGLGDTAVKESDKRVKMALRSSGFRFPTGRMITVNLAPADLRKAGPRYDLAIALGLLLIGQQTDLDPACTRDMAFIGELALDGGLRHVSGVLSTAIACRKHGISTIVVPSVDGPEAALIPELNVIAVENLSELVAILRGEKTPMPVAPPASSPGRISHDHCVDFSDIRGQAHCKRALEIAAAGGHNVLMSGPPGAGKTLLAKAFRGILPPLTEQEAIEVTQIYSVANRLPEDMPLIQTRPFRPVHHTASGVSIVGGGTVPGPGEISLAHKGVLFLDELAEFPANVLEVLRQPLEDRQITITRAQGTVTFPADFTLIAAMNPPEYSAGGARRIRRRISPPLLDRIDLTIAVDPVDVEDLQRAPLKDADDNSAILDRVVAARECQRARFAKLPMATNNEMGIKQIDQLCLLDGTCQQLMRQAMNRLGLSARAYHRTIKVARTIADLAGTDSIAQTHIAEALQYRQALEE